MKVLYVTHASSMGGANSSMLQLILELRSKYGIEPIVLAKKNTFPLNIKDKCKQYKIKYIEAEFFWFKGKKKAMDYIKYFFNWIYCYPVVFWKLRKQKFDLVHSNGSVIDLGAWISQFRHVKHVWHLREFGDLDFNSFPIFGKTWERYIYKKADCFVAISKCVQEAYLRVIPKDRMKLVYNGICLDKYKKKSNHTNEFTQLVMTGMIIPPKNQLEALKAFNVIIKHGYKASLHFFGFADEKYLDTLKQYVKDNYLDQNVIFGGMRDDIPEILQKMDVGLMLSKCEAFGRVTVEYMLQNLAVIVSDTGANPEIVKDGETGYIYPLGNVEKLAEKMILCIEDRERMRQIAERGRIDAMKRFSSEKNSDDIYAIYKNVMKRT